MVRALSIRTRRLLRSGKPYPFAGGYGETARGLINMASNESPFGPSPSVLKAIRRAVSLIGFYPDPGVDGLKKKVAGYLGIGSDHLVFGNGSDELIDIVCKSFLDMGDKVLIPLPTFSFYEIASRVNGGVPKFMKLRGFRWDSRELVSAAKDVKLVFIGRPNNPTGNGVDVGGIEDLLDAGKVVVVDEAYAEFAGYSVIGLVRRRENLVVLRTFSKAFGLAGLRVGYAVAHPNIAEVFERIRQPFSVNVLAQVAAERALLDQRYLRWVVSEVRRGREYLYEELSGLGMRVLPSDANFLMANVSNFGMGAREFCDFLLEHGILVRDLSGFRGIGPDWVRITVGTREQNEKLIHVLKKLEQR